jgi:hybrid cluster-associated redox disulfide protein
MLYAQEYSEENIMKITKDMIIADVLNMNRGTVPIFMQNGLHCMGCVMASGETIEEACMVHGMDCEILLDELNDFFDKQEA